MRTPTARCAFKTWPGNGDVSPEQAESRYELLKDLERWFLAERPNLVGSEPRDRLRPGRATRCNRSAPRRSI